MLPKYWVGYSPPSPPASFPPGLFVPKKSKIPSYGHFPPERLCDSIENHMGQKGFLWCSVVPKGSKIFQEWQFTPARLHDSIENHKGQRRPLGLHLYKKHPKLAKEWLSYDHFSPERLHDSIENHTGQKGDPWVLIFTKKIQNLSRNG